MNDYGGVVKTPAWILAKPQITSNVLAELKA